MGRLFGTDGVRGIANEFLSCEMAIEIGRALTHLLSSKRKYRPKIIIGMDTRISSEMLASSIASGICSVGGDVVMLGVVPTPAVAYLVKKYKAKAGIMISASHNPYNYNGIKIFGAEGFKLSDELEEQIESIVLDKAEQVRLADGKNIGKIVYHSYATDDYVNYLASTGNYDFSGMKIAIDCACGSASATAEKLFSRLGANCRILSANPNGININENCGSTHLENLRKFVLDNKMDVGIAFDGDADRCLAIDENGNEIDGDYIMAIIAKDMQQSGTLNKNTVVGTIMSNYGFQKFCEENDINFIAAKVGDRYVLEMLNLEGFSLGGEQSGHIILRDHATTGDGQLTAISLLALMKKNGKSLSELSSCMKKYPQHTVNISASSSAKLALFTDEDIKAIISETENKLSGRGRLVIRPSGTEPVVRIMIEDVVYEDTVALAENVAGRIAEKLKAY